MWSCKLIKISTVIMTWHVKTWQIDFAYNFDDNRASDKHGFLYT